MLELRTYGDRATFVDGESTYVAAGRKSYGTVSLQRPDHRRRVGAYVLIDGPAFRVQIGDGTGIAPTLGAAIAAAAGAATGEPFNACALCGAAFDPARALFCPACTRAEFRVGGLFRSRTR